MVHSTGFLVSVLVSVGRTPLDRDLNVKLVSKRSGFMFALDSGSPLGMNDLARTIQYVFAAFIM